MVQKRKRSRRWAFGLIGVVFVLGLGVMCYLMRSSFSKDSKTKEGEIELVTEKKDEQTTKETKVKTNDEDDGKKVLQYDGEDPNMREELSGSVTYAGILNDRIAIRVNIDQYLGNGQCELNMMKGEVSAYVATAKIVGAASTATCEGFDVPVGNVGAGNYEIVINLSSGDKTGVIRGRVEI